MLLRCAAAALRPRVPSPEWVLCAHARCSQMLMLARLLHRTDILSFIFQTRDAGHQDTRTLGHPLLFLCSVCFACDKCDRQTVRQCDSATVRSVNRVAPAARCPLLPASTTHNPPAFSLILIDRCMDAWMENGSFFIPVAPGLDAQNGA